MSYPKCPPQITVRGLLFQLQDGVHFLASCPNRLYHINNILVPWRVVWSCTWSAGLDLRRERGVVLRPLDSIRSSLLMISQSWFSQGVAFVTTGTISVLQMLGERMSWIRSAIVANLSNVSSLVESIVCMFVGRHCIHKDLNSSSDTLLSARSLMRFNSLDGRWLPSSVVFSRAFRHFSSLS